MTGCYVGDGLKGWYWRSIVHALVVFVVVLLYCGVASVATYFITDDQINSRQYQQTHLDVE